MRKIFILGLFLLSLTNLNFARAQTDDWQVVKVPDGVQVDDFIKQNGWPTDQVKIGTHGWLRVPADTAWTLSTDRTLLSEGDAMAEIQATIPNDYFYQSDQWDMTKIGMEQVWDDYRGSQSVIVAVLDTGLNMTHEDMKGVEWVNEGETNNNGIDDDQNGYIDDINGFNLIKENNNVWDDNGHGTAVSSVIGAHADNEVGIAGINWRITIMPVKVASASGTASLFDIAQGIYYAVDNGADMINMSLGSSTDRDFLYEAVQYAADNGVLMVAASGNSTSSNSLVKYPLYPSAYDEVMAIGATTENDEVASLSNSTFISHYGNNLDMVAPGVNIITADGENDDGYVLYDGTSLATPHVTGVAALMLAKNPTLTDLQIRQILIDTTVKPDDMSGDFDQHFGYGRLDAVKAMAAVDVPNNNDNNNDQNDPNDVIDPVLPPASEVMAANTGFANDWYMRPGELREVVISYKNVGSAVWPVRSDSAVRLGTDNNYDRTSAFYENGSWLTSNRISSYNIDEVQFGEEIKFDFQVQAPASTGNYNECFALVWDGLKWFENSRVCVNLIVTNDNVYSSSWRDQSDYLNLKFGDKGESWIEFVNNGTAAWEKEGVYPIHLGTDRPQDRYSLFNDAETWLSDNRIALDQDRVEPGEVGRFSFEVMTRSKGEFSEYFRPVVEGKQWMPDQGVFLKYNVN